MSALYRLLIVVVIVAWFVSTPAYELMTVRYYVNHRPDAVMVQYQGAEVWRPIVALPDGRYLLRLRSCKRSPYTGACYTAYVYSSEAVEGGARLAVTLGE